VENLSAIERVLCAIDTDDLVFATKLAKDLRPYVGGFKLGLEFFTAHGPEGVRKIQELGMPILLDLKFHDIPNTVAGAVRAATRLGVAMLTIHTGGSSDMMRQAVTAAQTAAGEANVPIPQLFGVTVLTSLDDNDLMELGYKQKASDRVKRLSEMAQLCGLSGVVASARELQLLEEQHGPNFRFITPGIRPAWAADAHDQKRVLEPAAAIAAGADYLVVGRPITRAKDPIDAAKRILAEVQSAIR
jgi:orotidine-5'-phosphate decarboxylase